MNHGRDFFMQEYRKVVLLCESWSQYHLSYSTSSLRFVPCDQPQEKRESGTTFFYPRNRKVQGMVFNSFSPFKHFFTPKMVETLSLCIYEKSIQFIIPFTFHIHNAIRHYCIFSFFIVCHLLGAYHYVRKRLLQHKARVQPRSIPLRQKEQRYLIITYGKANILRGESNSSVVSKISEQHCCVSRRFYF